MAKITPFERLSHQYDEWFDAHSFVYNSELEAIRGLLPVSGTGLEVGVGTGRFAEPLGISIGIEPSRAMGKMAQERGIDVIDAVAESLPLPDESFDSILFVTTVCFLNSMEPAFREALRVLKSSGFILVGLIDRESPTGRAYERHQSESPFYREATFHSVDEVVHSLKTVGFGHFHLVETIFRPLSEIDSMEPIRKGYGEGGFVVIRATK